MRAQKDPRLEGTIFVFLPRVLCFCNSYLSRLMNARLPKFLGRQGWTWATAAMVGWTPAAWGQAAVPSGRTGAASEMAVAGVATGALTPTARVELAWLGDPVTFPYALEVMPMGTVLEVRGNVPNQTVREHALKLARESSGLRVVDHLNLYTQSALPLTTKSPAALQQAAVDAIGRALPQQARNISVSIWTNGQVVLSGSVPSGEQKLMASRCLRGVAACSCVVNQLVVTGPYASVAPQSLEGDRSQTPLAPVAMLPAEPLPGSGIQQAAYRPEVETSPKVSAPAPAETPALPESKETSAPAAGSSTRNKFQPYQARWRRMEAAPRTTAAPVAAPSEPAPVTPTIGLVKFEEPIPAETPKAVPEISVESPNAKPMARAAVMELPAAKPVVSALPKTAARPAEMAPPAPAPIVVASPPPKPVTPPAPVAGWEATPKPFANASTASTGTVWFEKDSNWHSAPAAKAVEQPTSVPKATSAPQPRVATGTIYFEHAEPVQPRVEPALSPLESRLRLHIANLCGKHLAEVEVHSKGDKQVQIQVSAHSAQEAEQLSTKIFQMAELEPYQVALDIPLRP